MEYGLVTKAGYPFHHIEINGFQRHLSLENIGRNIVAIWHLALSGPRTRKILNEVKPDRLRRLRQRAYRPRGSPARHQDSHP